MSSLLSRRFLNRQYTPRTGASYVSLHPSCHSQWPCVVRDEVYWLSPLVLGTERHLRPLRWLEVRGLGVLWLLRLLAVLSSLVAVRLPVRKVTREIRCGMLCTLLAAFAVGALRAWT